MIGRIEIYREHTGQQDAIRHFKTAQFHVANELADDDVAAQPVVTRLMRRAAVRAACCQSLLPLGLTFADLTGFGCEAAEAEDQRILIRKPGVIVSQSAPAVVRIRMCSAP